MPIYYHSVATIMDQSVGCICNHLRPQIHILGLVLFYDFDGKAPAQVSHIQGI